MKNTIEKNKVNFLIVTENDENQRLDNFLIKYFPKIPKTHIHRIIRSGEVRINKKRAEAKTKILLNDEIRVPPLDFDDALKSSNDIVIPKKQFEILFEDDYLMIINKPTGTASHGGSGISFGVIEQVRASYPEFKFVELVHRLDKETSGILIIAKSRRALVAMQDIIRASKMHKSYLALSTSTLPKTTITVNKPLYKYLLPNLERRVRVDEELGKVAISIFNEIKHFDHASLIEAKIITGRTHQIRVHLQSLGCAIAMDDKYGNELKNNIYKKMGLKRLFLHAYKNEFTHPITNEKISIVCELPSDLKSFLDKM